MVDNKQQWKAWLYLLPAIILLLIFTVYPIVNSVVLAFKVDPSYQDKLNPNYVTEWGFDNFEDVITYGQGRNTYRTFPKYLKNTVILCLVTVPISTFLALLIAVALNSIKALQKLYQTLFFLPYVTNSVAIGMVFAAMFNMAGSFKMANPMIENYGVINDVIRFFGGTEINWIGDGSSYLTNYTVLAIYIIWNALPFKILILLGGLQSVNKQYYDAAKVDSTPKWRVFTKITVPLLSPMIAYVVITSFIGGFKEYTSVVGIYGKNMGPSQSQAGMMNTIVGYIYENLDGNPGRTSAAALILFGIIFAVTLVNLYVSKKKTHY